MSLFKRFFPPINSFRRQLLLTVTIGVISLAFGASLTTAWLQSNKVREQLIEEGQQIAENFASQSVLALVFSSKENATDSAQATLAFPNVKYVSILNKENKVLLAMGKKADWMPHLLHKDSVDHTLAYFIHETNSSLHFVSSVFAPKQGEMQFGEAPGLNAEDQEWLGYVHVALSKDALRDAQVQIFINNISVAVIFAFVLLLVLRVLVSRITSPLQELSGIMQQAEVEAMMMRAPLKGPAEIKAIAHVFNNMMTVLEERDRQLREQNENLEIQVNLRTRELVDARDQALLASRHKSEFLANMSHELRTPLNAIIGYTEIVLEEMEAADNEETVVDLRRVQKAANTLLTMINSILDLAKIEAGRMELYIEPTDLRSLVAEIAETVQVLVAKNNDTLVVDLQGGDEPLFMDSTKLRQIIINLLGNAAKFTTNGEIILQVIKTEHDLTIVVSDTGIGMTEEQQVSYFRGVPSGRYEHYSRIWGHWFGFKHYSKVMPFNGG